MQLDLFEKRGTVGIIWIDNPPVNAISLSVRVALMSGVAALSKDPQITVGVVACKGRTFMAGADITEFGRPFASPDLHETIDAIEACPKSIVAAIHGSALGGGLEVALACHYRVAVPQAQIGLPEVKLGILPGAGGTQRLPRLLGVEAALALMSSGDPVPAAEAAAGGVIDRIIEGDLIEGALAYAAEVAAVPSPMRRVRDRAIESATLPPGFFATARARLAREKRNLFAPQRIVDAVEAATTLPYDEGILRERELFARCMQSSQAGALQHAFFAERKAANIPSLDKAITRPIDRIAVIGAGTMPEPATSTSCTCTGMASQPTGGGPMYWAEHEVGLHCALEKLRRYSDLTPGGWLSVSPLLEHLVAEGRGFADAGYIDR